MLKCRFSAEEWRTMAIEHIHIFAVFRMETANHILFSTTIVIVMNQPQKELKEFTKFAEEKFINHKEELETTYQNRNVPSRDLQQAYLNHQQILEMELLDKIDELLTKETAYLGPLLSDIKDDYVNKLKAAK